MWGHTIEQLHAEVPPLRGITHVVHIFCDRKWYNLMCIHDVFPPLSCADFWTASKTWLQEVNNIYNIG
jgi:hypothetical protein